MHKGRAPASFVFAAVFMMTMALGPGLFALPPNAGGSATRTGFVGDGKCVSCHGQESAYYVHTAHHLTSQLPTERSVLGSFADGENKLKIFGPIERSDEPSLFFEMERRGDRFFETAVTGYNAQIQRRTEGIDVVIGSGKRGQTYLYWQGDRLFELPVSYWTAGQRWINSPGYEDGTANFSRPVHPGCMECHAAYIEPLSSDVSTNRFQRETFTPGISCETCHGPGGKHVTLHATAGARVGIEEIVNPARLPRDRQVELCALCHNGVQRKALLPAYSFVPGRPLSEYFEPIASTTAQHPDVHGNQVGLLERSQCYIASPTMTCSTCHNTHAPERTAASYSANCLKCHQVSACKVARTIGPAAASNCIDCHMPVEPTTMIVSETAGKETRAEMRNHWIRIYPNARAGSTVGEGVARGKLPVRP